MPAALSLDRFFPNVSESSRKPRDLDDPRREIAAGGLLAAALVIGLGGWAATARLDAAVITPGVVRVSASRQQIQAPAAGIVASVKVANGDHVRAGQVLVEFTRTDATAQERSLAARVFGLQAQVARIEAQLRGAVRVPKPAEFATLRGDDVALAVAALANEQAQLDSERRLESSEAAVLRDRAAQVREQIAGNGRRLASVRRQGALTTEELGAYQQLLAKGLATRPRVLALQRSAADLDGQMGQVEAEMGRLRVEVGETRLQAVQVTSERASRAADQLRTARTDLAAVLPQWQAARTQLTRTAVRAPFAGWISAAQMPFPEEVTATGQQLMEVVPATGALTVEARVALDQAADLSRGQVAQVSIAVAGGRVLPTIEGVVERVSNDSMEDDRTGTSFYTATIRLKPDDVIRVLRGAGLRGGIRPGTPVQVTVPTQKRSALSYLVGPFLQRTAGTFAQR